MSQIVEILADRIRSHRKAKGWTQEHLAEQCGLSIDFLRKLETGKTWVSRDSVKSLAEVLEVEESQLFQDPKFIPVEVRNPKKNELAALLTLAEAIGLDAERLEALTLLLKADEITLESVLHTLRTDMPGSTVNKRKSTAG